MFVNKPFFFTYKIHCWCKFTSDVAAGVHYPILLRTPSMVAVVFVKTADTVGGRAHGTLIRWSAQTPGLINILWFLDVAGIHCGLAEIWRSRPVEIRGRVNVLWLLDQAWALSVSRVAADVWRFWSVVRSGGVRFLDFSGHVGGAASCQMAVVVQIARVIVRTRVIGRIWRGRVVWRGFVGREVLPWQKVVSLTRRFVSRRIALQVWVWLFANWRVQAVHSSFQRWDFRCFETRRGLFGLSRAPLSSNSQRERWASYVCSVEINVNSVFARISGD